MEADQDGDGKLSFEEFAQTVANTVRFLRVLPARFINQSVHSTGYRQTNDPRRFVLMTRPSTQSQFNIPRNDTAWPHPTFSQHVHQQAHDLHFPF